MKQIHKIIRLSVVMVLLGTMLGAFGGIGQPGLEKVFAAGCIEHVSTDSQATAQMECVARYVRDCKDKDFGKNFCENLSVRQINRCAEDGNNYKLKRACLEEIRQNNNNDNDNTSDCTEDGCVNVGTEFDPEDCTNGLDGDCEVVDIVVVITNTLAALAATVIVAMIIWGGIQYSMAGADPAKVQAAKQKVINALIALMLLVFGFSIIQWLVPGGLI